MAFSDTFVTSGITEHQKNADLAIYLLIYLEQECDRHDFIWRGDQHVRSIQYTCHSLEALDLLNLKGVTDRLIGPAVDWLLELPPGRDMPSEDRRALHIYPSRFKALALLGKLDSERLESDFAELSQLFDPDSGWIRDTPFAINQALTTMIWVDVLLHLGSLNMLSPELLLYREQALQAIAEALEAWTNRAAFTLAFADQPPAPLSAELRQSKPGDIMNPGDASYAFDLLLRAGQLSVDSPHSLEVQRLLTGAIRRRRLSNMRDSDLLYCGIHLRAHFPGDTETRAVIEAFISELRERYQNNECQREPLSFHALVLRLLMAHHGGPLREAILEKLWTQNRELADSQQRLAQEHLEAAFVALIRQSMDIHLSRTQPITGKASQGEVYRLVFGLTTAATDERGSTFSLPSNSLRLIVKKGPPDMLARASERYRELPEPLQGIFARHAYAQDGHAASSGYLVMQDLADMRPLSEILAQFGRPILRRENYEDIATAASTVAEVMRTLHDFERRRSIIGHQFNLIYLTPIVDCLDRLCQPHAFPILKQWVEGTLEANGWAYKRLDWYLKRLLSLEPRLGPSGLSYTHGDCHSRNLMLSHDLKKAKFVDLETLSRAEDYIVDYGLLIEDVAIYQSVRPRMQGESFAWDDVQTSRPDNESNTLENWIVYPAFPQGSEVDLLFQRELMGHLKHYADNISDANWKERLWLAIIRGLFLLAAHQLTSHTVEPRRRRNNLKLVQIAYAEALRLLHELVDHLEPRRNSPLPDLPFPGEHRPPPQRSRGKAEALLVASLLDGMNQEFSDKADWLQAQDTPYFIDYFTRPEHRLFARVHTKSGAPVLYLACRPDQLDDPHQLAQPSGAAEMGVRIQLTSAMSLPEILTLVQQAYRIAAGSSAHPEAP